MRVTIAAAVALTVASVLVDAQRAAVLTDREELNLRGPVRAVRLEFAELNPQTNDWGPFKQQATLLYGQDGQLEGRARDGDGVLSTTLDARGLRTTVSRWPPRIRRQEGMEYGVGVDPRVLADVLTRYDAADRPVEIVFRDATQKSLNRIELTYDANGRLSREKLFNGDVIRAERGFQEQVAGNTTPLSAQELAEFAATMKVMMPDGVFMTREYQYDQRGRVVELRSTMAVLSETRQTYSYDDHDNVIEEHSAEVSREASVGRRGRVTTSNETSSENWGRHVYVYDDRGNWVEKVNLRRESSDRDFKRLTITRRTITYY
jgi:YD repeat-containing protein